MKNTRFEIEEIKRTKAGFSILAGLRGTDDDSEEYRIKKDPFFFLLQRAGGITEYLPETDEFSIAWIEDSDDIYGEHVQTHGVEIFPTSEVLEVLRFQDVHEAMERMMDIEDTWKWIYKVVPISGVYKSLGNIFSPVNN